MSQLCCTLYYPSMRPGTQAPPSGFTIKMKRTSRSGCTSQRNWQVLRNCTKVVEGSLPRLNTLQGYNAWYREEKSPEPRTWRDRRLWAMFLKRCLRQKSWFLWLTRGSAVPEVRSKEEQYLRLTCLWVVQYDSWVWNTDNRGLQLSQLLILCSFQSSKT